VTIKHMNKVIEGLTYSGNEFLCFTLMGTVAIRYGRNILTPSYPATRVRYYPTTHRLYVEGVGGPWWWTGVVRG
jgi:hypothetical protein